MQVMPGRALPQLGVHPQPHFGQSVLRPGGFMTAADPRGNVGVEPRPRFRERIMAGHGLAKLSGFPPRSGGSVRPRQDPRKIHHFPLSPPRCPTAWWRRYPPAPDRLPYPRSPAPLKHTGRRGHHHLQGRALRLLHHHGNARKPQDVGDFMGIHINAHRSVRHHRPGVLPHRQHGRFHMDVPVQEAGGQIPSLRIHHPCLRTDATTGVPHQSDTPLAHRHIGMWQDLPITHIDQAGIPDNGVRLLPSLRHRRQGPAGFPQRHPANFVVIDHASFGCFPVVYLFSLQNKGEERFFYHPPPCSPPRHAAEMEEQRQRIFRTAPPSDPSPIQGAFTGN